MKIKRLEDDIFVTYECKTKKELEDLIDMWKKKYRKENDTDKVIFHCGKDIAYERYCKELDELLNL